MKTEHTDVRLFNTAVEIGLRSLVLFGAFNMLESNRSLDLDRIMYLDYLLLHTGDIDGPESIHAPVPKRGVQVYSRRKLLQQGLVFLLSKELINFDSSINGFSYRINEAGILFLELFSTDYFDKLRFRASWIASQRWALDIDDLRVFIQSNIYKWGGEFIDNEFLHLL